MIESALALAPSQTSRHLLSDVGCSKIPLPGHARSCQVYFDKINSGALASDGLLI